MVYVYFSSLHLSLCFVLQISDWNNFGPWILDNDATFITRHHNKSAFSRKESLNAAFWCGAFLWNGRLKNGASKQIICRHFASLKRFTGHILHDSYLRSKWFSGMFATTTSIRVIVPTVRPSVCTVRIDKTFM